MPQAKSIVISVVLCTYNRCELMASALRSVCEQTLDPSRYEVIVVDNNSTDGTKQCVLEMTRQYPHVRYCFEVKQGASHGRNAGVQVARGRYIACIDDDCKVPKEWLSIAQAIIESDTPGLFGGPYRPFYNSPKPQWYKDSYGALDYGPLIRALGEQEYLAGTNLFIRRSLLEQVGGFNPSFGGVGYKRGYGEETVIQCRVRRDYPDETIHYYPGLCVFHLVRQEKMTLLWCAMQMFQMGQYWQRVLYDTAYERTHTLRAIFRASRAMLHLFQDLVWGIAARDRSRYPFVKNYLYEVVFVQLQALGAAYEQLTHRSS